MSKQAFRIRPWRAGAERETVAALWRRAWASANPHVEKLEPHEHWLARVKAEFVPPCDVLVMEVEDNVAAFMVLDLEAACLEQLFTEPALQGRGLGTAMLDEACRRLPGGWMLHVATGNRRAQALYGRYGLTRGATGRNPVTGRERVAWHWAPAGRRGSPA